MDIQIVLAKKREYSRLSEIYAKEFSKKPYGEPWTKDLALKKLKLLSKYCEVYSVFYNGRLVGFFALNCNKFFPGGTVELEEFGIDGAYQNKGIGKFCLRWIEEEFTKRGYEGLIFLSIKTSKAYKIYKRLGYKEDRVNAIFYKKLK